MSLSLKSSAFVFLNVFLYCVVQAKASRYLFIFGDSYTTTAFEAINHPLKVIDVPLGDPASHETTSDGGKNWVDVVVANTSQCDTTTYNYAVGANTVNASRADVDGGFTLGGPIKDLRDQENEFAKNNEPWDSNNTVVMHWFGINDVAVQVWSGRNLDDSEAILKPDVDDYFRLLERQHGLGARRFVTILMPPIHRAPVFNYGFSPEADKVKALAEYWNSYMREEREKFLHHYPNTTAVIFDPSPGFNRILDDPHNYGLPQVKAKHGAASLWHDFIHPGVDIQKEVGKELCNVLAAHWPCAD